MSFGIGVINVMQVVQATVHMAKVAFDIAFAGPVLDRGALGTASAASSPFKVFNLELR